MRLTVTGMSKNVAIVPSFFAWSFNFSSTVRPPFQLPMDVKSAGHLRRFFRADNHKCFKRLTARKGRHAHQCRKVLRRPLAVNRDSPTSCLCERFLRLIGTWGGVELGAEIHRLACFLRFAEFLYNENEDHIPYNSPPPITVEISFTPYACRDPALDSLLHLSPGIS
ncbi:hypothetical protein PoB_007481700 [Plakobranchus ocellatus]|uniref:Uncharacterized protein n=1 Tax=Plakobranchus ocellatus TaxID=259542 RepID=A0AAV4DVE6_9GAST|nr:hypothetical protein PoB_007481700 [Plakobranchus ocellatus]